MYPVTESSSVDARRVGQAKVNTASDSEIHDGGDNSVPVGNMTGLAYINVNKKSHTPGTVPFVVSSQSDKRKQTKTNLYHWFKKAK